MVWFGAVHGYAVRFVTLLKAIGVLFPITIALRFFDSAFSGPPLSLNFMFLISPPTFPLPSTASATDGATISPSSPSAPRSWPRHGCPGASPPCSEGAWRARARGGPREAKELRAAPLRPRRGRLARLSCEARPPERRRAGPSPPRRAAPPDHKTDRVGWTRPRPGRGQAPCSRTRSRRTVDRAPSPEAE